MAAQGLTVAVTGPTGEIGRAFIRALEQSPSRPRRLSCRTSASRCSSASTRAEWLHTLRTPVVMSIDKARHVLGWDPRYDALDTLRETVAGAREAGLLPGG